MPIIDYENQYEDYRRDHPLTEAEMSDPRFVEAARISRELKEQAWDPKNKMTAVLGGYKDADGNFHVDPMVGLQAEIAIARAREQLAQWDEKFREQVMPEDTYASDRFPNRDPMGKYSVIEMQFEDRRLRLLDAVAYRSEEALTYAQELYRNLGRNSRSVQTILEHIPELSREYRLLSRAEKLCLDPEGRAILHERSHALKSAPAVVLYDKYIQGMEYAAGVRSGPVPQEVQDAYASIGVTLDQQKIERAQRAEPVPTDVKMYFEDYDSRIRHRFATLPENWGLSTAQLDQKFDQAMQQGTLNPVLVENGIPPYVRATVDSYLRPYYAAVENSSKNHRIDRSTLILIEGKTVREMMLEDHLAAGNDVYSFNQQYAGSKYFRRKADEYIAAALMSGRRVEAFIPDRNGRIPDEPVQITKDGYTPSPLKKVTLNAWERFFAKHGFYKEKVKKAAEYQTIMEARQRLKTSYFCSRTADIVLGGHDSKEAFFGNYMRTHNGQLPDNRFQLSQTRSAYPTLAAFQMIVDGYSIDDVFNPQKLQAEKLQAGDKVAAKLAQTDPRELAQLFLQGQLKVLDYLDEKTRSGLSLLDMKQLATNENQTLVAAVKCAYDAVQEVQRTSTLYESYQAAFRNYMNDRKIEVTAENARREIEGNLRGVQLPRVEFNPKATEREVIFNPLSTISQFMDYSIKGLEGSAALNSGLAEHINTRGAHGAFWDVVTMQAVRQVFLDAQTKQPDVPLSRVLTHDQLEESRAGGYTSLMSDLEPSNPKVPGGFGNLANQVANDVDLQRNIGRDALTGKISERMNIKIDPHIKLDFNQRYDESVTDTIRRKFAFEFKAPSKENVRAQHIQAQNQKNEQARATEKAAAKTQKAPERGRSR